MSAKTFRQVALYISPEAHARLKELTARTRVPMTAYLREAIDDLLRKYERKSK